MKIKTYIYTLSLAALSSLYSCGTEESTQTGDPCHENFTYQDGSSWISDVIAQTDQTPGLNVLKADKWIDSDENYFVFKVFNAQRVQTEFHVYTCTNSLIYNIVEDNWQDFRDSGAFATALFKETLYGSSGNGSW